MIAEATDDDVPQTVAAATPPPSRPAPVAARVPTAAGRAAEPIAEGDEADSDDAATFQVAAVKPVAKPRLAPSPADRGWKKGPDAAGAVDPRPVAAFATRDQPARLGWVKGADPAKAGAKASAETTIARRSDDDAKDGESASVGGWIIQLGATENPAKANALLAKARAHSRALLADAKPVTEKVRKGGDTLYRARFAGLEQSSAQSACRTLKRSGFECFATRD
jgi:D-alanyl-D-alanine carboxypeptidase